MLRNLTDGRIGGRVPLAKTGSLGPTSRISQGKRRAFSRIAVQGTSSVEMTHAVLVICLPENWLIDIALTPYKGPRAVCRGDPKCHPKLPLTETALRLSREEA